MTFLLLTLFLAGSGFSCVTKQPARASLTFTTKFLCLRNPPRARLEHSNRVQGQGGARTYPGGGWYRWTCVTWRQFTDAPLDSKHSSIPARHGGEAFRDKLFRVSGESVQGPKLHAGLQTRCLETPGLPHDVFRTARACCCFSPVKVRLSPLVFGLRQLPWLPRAGKALKTAQTVGTVVWTRRTAAPPFCKAACEIWQHLAAKMQSARTGPSQKERISSLVPLWFRSRF